MLHVKLSRPRLFFLIGLITLAFVLVMVRLVYLYHWRRDYYLSFLEKNRSATQILYAQRGQILDTKGKVFANNEPLYEVGIDPQMTNIKDFQKLGELAKHLHIPVGRAQAAFDQKTAGDKVLRWHKLAEDVSPENYEKIKNLHIRGVYSNPNFRRSYPCAKSAAHVLGYINKEGTPVMGVERALDFYLKGQDGWREIECDGRRTELPQYRRREVAPTFGKNIVLSIDSVIQDIVEEELNIIQRDCLPQSASIIVSEARTGFILALANSPSFDPNTFFQTPIDSHRNRCITDVYEPASVFKILTLSAIINENIVPLNTVVDCSLTSVTHNGKTYSLPKDWRDLEKLTLPEVFYFSSNRGVAQLSLFVGRDRLYRYAKAFGFGEKTGFQLDFEVEGMLPHPSKWDDLTVTRFPIGHGNAATAMQVHYAMSVLANNGVLLYPQIVRRIENSDGAIEMSFSPREKRRAILESTAKTAASMLDRTDPNLRLEGVRVCGKTSTSQKIIDGRYSHTQHISAFSGFFPLEDPKIVVTVVVDSPKVKGVAYGIRIAGPSFQRIGNQLTRYLKIDAK